MIGTGDLKEILGYQRNDPRTQIWRWVQRGWITPAQPANGSGTRVGWSRTNALQALVLDSLAEADTPHKRPLSHAAADWWNSEPMEAFLGVWCGDALLVDREGATAVRFDEIPEAVKSSRLRFCSIVPLEPLRMTLAQ